MTGGGVAYIRAQQALADVKGDNADEQTGIAIIRRAIEEPSAKSAAMPAWKAQ